MVWSISHRIEWAVALSSFDPNWEQGWAKAQSSAARSPPLTALSPAQDPENTSEHTVHREVSFSSFRRIKGQLQLQLRFGAIYRTQWESQTGSLIFISFSVQIILSLLIKVFRSWWWSFISVFLKITENDCMNIKVIKNIFKGSPKRSSMHWKRFWTGFIWILIVSCWFEHVSVRN